MHTFRVRPRGAFKYYCDIFNHRSYQNSGFDVFVLYIQIFSFYGDRSQIYPKWRWLMGEGPFVAIIQRKKGSTWLQVILLSYGLFPTESEWGVGSIHSMKNTAGFSFLPLSRYSRVKMCNGWGTVRYHHSVIRKLHFVWFGWLLSMSIFGDGGVGFKPARYFYLNMGVKLVMVKDQRLCLLEYDLGANALG